MEEKEIDRILLKVGHIGSYRLQYGHYNVNCARWIWNDIPSLHEGTPSGPPPTTDPFGNIIGSPSGITIRKYFFPPLTTKAVRLLITPTDLSGNPHELYEFQIYGNPFNILYANHYFIDFWKDADQKKVALKNLDFWIGGIMPTQFSDFMETKGHTWRTPPNNYSFFDRQINPLRLYRNDQSDENFLFYGTPHNYTLKMRQGDRRDFDGWSLTLQDVDLKEDKVLFSVKNGDFEKKIFIKKRFGKKICGELFVDANQNDAERETMYAIDHDVKDNMIFLEYHPDPADPLHDTVVNTSMSWHTQNSTSRARAYWDQLSGNLPPPLYPFAVFDGRMLERNENNFRQRTSENLSSPRIELVANGDIDRDFIYVSGGFRLLYDFSKMPTELHLKYLLYERNVMLNGALHDYVVRGIVEEADTVFQNHSKENWWSYHELEAGEKYLFFQVFDLNNCDWNISIENPKNVGIAVILQRYECSLCPWSYDIAREILNSSAYDEVRGNYFPPSIVDTEENFYPTFEVAEDLDEDGKKEEVTFAIENVYAGMGTSGEKYATFNAYTLTDYGVLHPGCCFYEEGGDTWDLFIFSDSNPQDFIHEGGIKVSLRQPLCIPCEGEGIFYGPRRYFKLISKKIFDEEKSVAEILEHHSFSASPFLIQKTNFTYKTIISKPEQINLIKFDYEVGEREGAEGNLILFGKDNSLVAELKGNGFSHMDWEKSEGDLEYIKNVWGAHDVLIVAGGSREAFETAVSLLLQYLESLPSPAGPLTMKKIKN